MRYLLPIALVATLALSACGSNETPTSVGYSETPALLNPTGVGYAETIIPSLPPKVCK